MRLWIVIMLQLCGAALYSQCTLRITGRVTDTHTSEPLTYASVFIEERGWGVITDSLGEFNLTGLCPGLYTLRITHLDCDDHRSKVKLQAADVTLNVQMEHHSHELGQVTIISHTDKSEGEIKSSIPQQFIRDMKLENLAQSLSYLSGISSLKTGNSIEKPLIHGMSGSRIAIINEGSRLEDQQWGMEHAPTINTLLFDQVEVVKGASSVKYGAKALGGIVLMRQSVLYTQPELNGLFDISLSSNAPGGSSSISLQQGFKKNPDWGWKIAGLYGRHGDLVTPAYILSNTGDEAYSLGLSVGKKTENSYQRLTLSNVSMKTGILASAEVASVADLELALQSDKPLIVSPHTFRIGAPYQHANHYSLIYNGKFSKTQFADQHIHFSAQWNKRREYDARRIAYRGAPSADMNLFTAQGSWHTDLHWRENFHTEIGFAGLTQYNYNDPATGRRPIIPQYYLINPALYITSHNLIGKLAIEGGFRYDYTLIESKYYNLAQQLINDRRNFSAFTAAIGFNYELYKNIFIMFNSGLGFRPPDPNELYSDGVHQSAAAYETGDPNLNVERSWKNILAFNIARQKIISDLNIFFQPVQNFIYLQPEGYKVTLAGAKFLYAYKAADVRLWGLDHLFIWKIIPQFRLQNKFSFVRGIIHSTGQNLPNIPPISNESMLEWQQHFKNNDEWSLAAGVVYTAREKKVAPEFLILPAPASWFICNVRLRYKPAHRVWDLTLSADNIFNQQYSNYLNRLRMFAPLEPGTSIKLLFNYQFLNTGK